MGASTSALKDQQRLHGGVVRDKRLLFKWKSCGCFSPPLGKWGVSCCDTSRQWGDVARQELAGGCSIQGPVFQYSRHNEEKARGLPAQSTSSATLFVDVLRIAQS